MSADKTFDYLAIKPISTPIEPKKQGAKRHWGSHPYFTRRAWNVVQEYIRTFSQLGDVVLDPFGGTGVTAVEALVLKRKAIHCDINPLANFICSQIAVSPVDINAFRAAFDEIERNCKEAINEVYTLPDAEVENLEIVYWYPQGIRLPQNADAEYVEQLFTQRQLFSLSLLLHHIKLISDSRIRDLMKFTFSATLNKTNLTFSSTRGRLASRGNSGIMHRYRYWIPPNTLDLNVWEQFSQKFRNTVKFKLETNLLIDQYQEHNLSIFNLSATSLTKDIENESIDYIYTDPPYGQHIAYLDLSTMWNAWLDLEVTDTARQFEAIEGGDLKKTKQEYIDLLSSSIKEMFKVLKFDRWLSIVFAHKDPAYWDAIVKSAQEAGFEYVNTAVQPSKTPSLHKRKNPLTVLSGELVLNFRKVRNPKTIAISKVGTNIVSLIKEVAQLTIVKNDGASTEDIYNALIPKLLENGLLGEVKKQIEDITDILREEFIFSDLDNLWRIKPNTKIGCFIPLEDRIRFYLMDYLNRMEREWKKATFDDIILNVMPNLINGQTPPNQTILNVLEKIAFSSDGKHWQLSQEEGIQIELDLGTFEVNKLLPSLTFPQDPNKIEHDAIIYALAKIGLAAGLRVHIGKKEQGTSSWNGEAFSNLSLSKLPIQTHLQNWSRGKIQQIDLIWFDSLHDPVFAFEVETSTSITTGIDRFMELLKIFPDVAKKIVLIIPPKRLRKMNQLLQESHYIGHPLYMENKLVYSFSDSITKIYKTLSTKKILDLQEVLADINSFLISPGESDN
ncbi:D12 class N6 adenine-specific DNA methyltransferase family protein [Lyngbya aestuarii BL J]|uniref:D12 class N6 adenine-specific DNA methyltransferase family protein n=1 Tax=Lyngbya aestuarii BL J TaxID=1348334 RepID=U7QMB4_9CYAN|nr:DNA methyltransferase [Lyngbya aestuarii]ERT09023.1 D12 class N6 adenine-specific DNA methyltransferase family protein [Lyngbya aestuarii BL J]